MTWTATATATATLLLLLLLLLLAQRHATATNHGLVAARPVVAVVALLVDFGDVDGDLDDDDVVDPLPGVRGRGRECRGD